jgi:pyruvate/2-oxoglutarate dehydrogenase complex dihydrolipoamide dehydrogenase (E3) component
MPDDHDVIVIGMGVGGEEVAGRLADAGMNVLAVERKLVGGECPYWGCIPSKIMVRAGNSVAEAARALGLAGEVTISPRWAPVAARVREATAGWDDSAAVKRHLEKGESFVRGEAHITGSGAVEVDGRTFQARRGVVIATGGEPAAPPIEGLAGVDYWTNRDAIEASELPASMIVLGAGPIGLELAQTFHRFGTEITIVELAGHALPMEEPENGEALGAVLRSEGIALLTGAAATSVRAAGTGVEVELEGGEKLGAERLLVATGRRLNLKSLGIENVGLDPDGRSIETDGHMRAGDGVWAVGDITGVGAFTHLAVYQGRIAAADLLGADHRPADYRAVPRVTFTDPEVASVGLSEAGARDQGISVRIGIATTSSSARGWIHGPGAEHGVTKLVADADQGVLVGASTMGPAAGEVLGLLVLAVNQRVPVRVLRDLIYPYPTFVRGLEDALRDLDG